jgi:hypothetical protein
LTLCERVLLLRTKHRSEYEPENQQNDLDQLFSDFELPFIAYRFDRDLNRWASIVSRSGNLINKLIGGGVINEPNIEVGAKFLCSLTAARVVR